jgi:hypothetical protein
MPKKPAVIPTKKPAPDPTGARDLWKENYRRAKLLRFHTEPPNTPPDPEQLEYERQYRECEQAKADRFNQSQQKRYEEWLKKRKAAQ